eukprot:TRINITY_DN9138_c0_g1_i1.p1 TRINITY_DN9138_c0_g1~~TRINITY_DN9138_c0_g1_i1.p1  ORF type:complete len:90 (-),score=6.78 TRINITY_DN9138_c0_g1_i1:60-329(-)
MVANSNPMLVFYCDSFVLMASQKYDANTLDFRAHITNSAITNNGVGDTAATNNSRRVSMETLQERLRIERPGLDENYVSDDMVLKSSRF